ncbi:hypothetical protein EW145_g343 [Phellinidium pouzarii]|uniref:Uncharacterized protein n=1 Tax=Phellinidium pouzarii TaxID=167371 RepID=A0A4S4LJC1_9AGAM|nr:hypothetical protein EW145_g343 [Phellinidium pouzarii]
MQIIINISSGATLSLRLFALYEQSLWILLLLVPCLVAEITVESWAVSGGVPVLLPSGQIGCILTGKSTQGNRFAAFWIGQLVFPTIIFVLTFARAFRSGFMRGGILEIILRDGLIYFLVIFCANLMNVVTYATALEDVKFINAPFTNVITSLMICRLTLNLRAGRDENVETLPSLRFTNLSKLPTRHSSRPFQSNSRALELSTFSVSHD